MATTKRGGMDRPELYGAIDSLAAIYPPGCLRMNAVELQQWLESVARRAMTADAKALARRAAKAVGKLIEGTYALPNRSPAREPEPPPSPALLSVRGFPDSMARACEAHGVRTVADLAARLNPSPTPAQVRTLLAKLTGYKSVLLDEARDAVAPLLGTPAPKEPAHEPTQEAARRHDGTGTEGTHDPVPERAAGAAAAGDGVRAPVLPVRPDGGQPVRVELPPAGHRRGAPGGGRPAGEEAGRAPVADFDERTPPPRRRPQGDPVGRYVVLPPGESAAALFAHWDSHGRVPEGCVLAEHVGRELTAVGGRPGEFFSGRGEFRGSGYRVAGLDAMCRTPLGPVGAEIPEDAMAGWTVRVVVVEKGRHRSSWVVLAPPENPVPARAVGRKAVTA